MQYPASRPRTGAATRVRSLVPLVGRLGGGLAFVAPVFLFGPAMALILRCGKCARRLQVRDEDAGKQVRCPACGAVLAVPVPTRPAVPGVVVADPPAAVGSDPQTPPTAAAVAAP